MTDEKITRELTEIYDFIDSVVPNKRDATTIKLQFKYFENIESQLAEAEMKGAEDMAQMLIAEDPQYQYPDLEEHALVLAMEQFKAQRAKSEVEDE